MTLLSIKKAPLLLMLLSWAFLLAVGCATNCGPHENIPGFKEVEDTQPAVKSAALETWIAKQKPDEQKRILDRLEGKAETKTETKPDGTKTETKTETKPETKTETKTETKPDGTKTETETKTTEAADQETSKEMANIKTRLQEYMDKEKLEEFNKKLKEQNDYKTWTTASVVYSPELSAAQPALIQSFSLRNFIQWAWANHDPSEVRRKVKSEIATDSTITLDGKECNLKNLDFSARKEVIEAIVDERLSQRSWLTAMDILSLDIGLTAPALNFGNKGDRFKNKVDPDFPQFLFGGGLHYGGIEASGGAMLYRGTDSELKTAFYFGISVELYTTALPFGK